MKILVIDNYDSFTFNLVQQLGILKCKVIVKKNDEISLNNISKIKPDKILISPGPKKPEDSKISLQIIKELGSKIPILGVCLGHQAIALTFGGKVTKANHPVHGITSKILHNGKNLFKGIPQSFVAMRYHSLIVEKESLPPTIETTAQTQDGIIMGIRHKSFPIEGIQFHPESILTTHGSKIILNWLKL
ncbi:MAG: aminodeoxychorismate/anthranilate synthase component II [Ignavibacteriaceae bacterium]|nr:aminodeoxychorismate/anthranilate synthase component II [Ignavibacterium sp.]MCC6255899.1 aminodeoxychorismate/anthranilate synthase component II [Ignavibacteriaceae bacterium]HMN23139.1 aminodeoxychorismate/anthranilate synthase component II [Ignavibacteriaceae bacterium]HRN24946.1 aminodeoxychorismate/anthranilate synthase component II [Ignavibacteriaceae bacterium]HRP93515.1 aminodeoxychorismate/anthranilate synthase component II [Ignavibacteriaceae bacterium]